MNAPVRTSPPSGVPSEAVAEIRCSRVARKRAARALFGFVFGEPCPTRAMADAAMRHRPCSNCQLDRTMSANKDVREGVEGHFRDSLIRTCDELSGKVRLSSLFIRRVCGLLLAPIGRGSRWRRRTLA